MLDLNSSAVGQKRSGGPAHSKECIWILPTEQLGAPALQGGGPKMRPIPKILNDFFWK